MSDNKLELISRAKSFGGWLETYTHQSESCHCPMRFSIYLPPQSGLTTQKSPVLYWLSGLTCTNENFSEKSGAMRYAAEYGIVLVIPDTSPRGEGVPDDPEKGWDFGLGAGFYLNATQNPWSEHYRMYDYIVSELPALVTGTFPVDPTRKSIFGHSMGGHGALTIALKNPGEYLSVSAFAPVVAPSDSPWGKKAFANYLGENTADWAAYDACLLIQRDLKERLPILVDQGQEDGFLTTQLFPEKLQEACQVMKHPLTLRYQAGYDHSYYFIATFIGEHIAYHDQFLKTE